MYLYIVHAGLGAAFGDGSNVNNGANGSIRIYYLNFNRFFLHSLNSHQPSTLAAVSQCESNYFLVCIH